MEEKTEFNIRVDKNVKKQFKVRCAMDDVKQVNAIEKLMQLYADGKISFQ